VSANALVLQGELRELSALRRTPAGVAVIEGVISHRSRQLEAGHEREVTAEVPFVMVGNDAPLLAQGVLGATVSVNGFVAARSLKSNRLVLHVTEMRFVEGNENGFQTEAP